jgi:hypothetical protein
MFRFKNLQAVKELLFKISTEDGYLRALRATLHNTKFELAERAK